MTRVLHVSLYYCYHARRRLLGIGLRGLCQSPKILYRLTRRCEFRRSIIYINIVFETMSLLAFNPRRCIIS